MKITIAQAEKELSERRDRSCVRLWSRQGRFHRRLSSPCYANYK